ncbi:SHC-transforming protein 3 isoform X1 [Hippocampus comes]|uniref:SHC-transforming protein 3 isoform X1 n=1 Tax=Hippocampus comes TaxID=109280 RepID=UPI00094E6113|nr:PREDICTED: SHC-transforming protein 3 isoform X1 [Hippocampus comes]XP_019738458.1 PREDICTED: SHC-transforming protein 3 isoform X1 [Hippocampus comes]
MLHRTKYNRFRNESVTSVDDIVHGLSMNPKVSASPETPYTPPADVQPLAAANAPSAPAAAAGHDHSDDGGTPLCTLINKVSNLKFSNSGSLLGIKGLPSAVKDLAVAKLQGGGGSGASLGVAAPGAAACLSAPEPAVGMSKKSRLDEIPLGGEDWNPGCGGPVGKPFRGWLHSSEKISGPGVTYIVKYLGCIEVLRSMRSLDFTTRSQITREAISLVCEAVPPTKGALRKRKPPSKALSNILGKSNLQFAGMSINLNISTSSLNLMTPDCKQIIANHHMQSISFASGGDPDTTDFVAYVAKDPVNRRACHILECSDGLAQDVIGTIGQAFDLRFQQYMQCPSSKPSTTHDRVFNVEELPWTEDEEESAEHPYYNNVPGKMPPPGGFIDARLTNPNAPSDGSQMGTNSVDQNYYQGRHCGENWTEERKSIFIQQGSLDQSSESKGPVTKADEMPTYMNTQQIDEQVLAALQAEAEHVTKGMAATARENPPTDLFDMTEPFEDALQSQPQAPSQVSALHKATSVDNSSPLLARSIAFRAQEELEGQAWYRGKMSRRAAEKLLHDDGDFLVRKSATNPGSYVLTGMHNGIAKHLLLVDPEGTVRTKDHVFDSISHLIGHHRDNNLPIVSAGSELCLLQPVVWKQ